MLKPAGRSAVIVPQGVLFGGSKAHLALRQHLLDDNQVEAVISLPGGVFKPYAGVATAILLFTKSGRTEEVWFYDVESDGRSLDDKRVQLDDHDGDLADVREQWVRRAGSVSTRSTPTDREAKSFVVSAEEIRAGGYDLTVGRYRQAVHEEKVYETPKAIIGRLEELFETQIQKGLSHSRRSSRDESEKCFRESRKSILPQTVRYGWSRQRPLVSYRWRPYPKTAESFGAIHPAGEVLKGFTAFQRGDILLAKIAPCMENGKAAFFGPGHEYGFGSTEFHVVRPGPNIDGRYLFYMLWNPVFRREAAMNMTGSAGQKRVPSDFLKRFTVPVPESKAEQRRISDVLDAADALRRQRAAAIRLADDLVPSVFHEMFGKDLTNPQLQRLKTLPTLAQEL